MSAPATDQRLHADAWAALLATQLGPGRVFERGDVPGLDGNAGSTPNPHVLLDITRRYVETANNAGAVTRSGWRVGVMVVAKTVYEARATQSKVARVEGFRLDAGGARSTRVVHESTEDPGPDDGWYSAESVWTYAL